MGRERDDERGGVGLENGYELRDIGWIKWVKMRYFRHFPSVLLRFNRKIDSWE